ncbi:unnamed protein product, partial [marine sediment metagenome]
MADDLKNFVTGDAWLIELAAEDLGPRDPGDLEHYLQNEPAHLWDSNHKFKLPRVISILPIRNAVAYPGTVTPLAIGRRKSKRLIAETTPNESVIGLVTQRNPETDDPDFDGIYSVGTAATILKIIKMPQGLIHIVVHGVARFRITKRVATEPYLKAAVRLLAFRTRMTKNLQA